MITSTSQAPGVDRWEDSPIAWVFELFQAVEAGCFDRAAECQRELRRLGWRVDRHVGEDQPPAGRRRRG